MTTRLRGLILGGGLAMGLFAAQSQALPPVADRIPTNAVFFVTVPSIDRLEKGLAVLKTNLELPVPIPGIKEMLAMGGFDQAMDTSKSMALVMMPGDLEADPPPIVMLIPTTDMKKFVEGMGGKVGDGVMQLTINGDPAFAKSVGENYVAMGPTKDIVTAFTGAAGNLKAHDEALGKVCNAVADASDVAIVANMAVLGPVIGPKLKAGMEEAMANSPMGMMGGGEGPDLKGVQAMLDKVIKESKTTVIGLHIDQTGVGMDMAARFNEGTTMAATFAKAGDSGTILKKLPDQPYLLAFAADTSLPGLKKFSDDMSAMFSGGKAGKEKDPGLFMVNGDKAAGYAASIGLLRALFGGGALVNTVLYCKTADSAGYIKDTQKMISDLNGKVMNGTTFTTSFAEGATKVGDLSVDSWEVKMKGEGEDATNQQIMMMLFGPTGGPNGYIAKADGGVVQTFSKNSVLVQAAVDAAKGTKNAGGDAALTQVSQKLPSDRFFEGYLGIKSILELVKPMMAMMGGAGGDFPIPDALPPIGLGAGGKDGSLHAGFFVPMPVIKTVGSMIKTFQAGMGGEGGDEPAAAPKKKETGQPRF